MTTRHHKESEFEAAANHPKLLRLIKPRIKQLAEDMGFSSSQIKTKEFRAEREGGRMVRVMIG